MGRGRVEPCPGDSDADRGGGSLTRDKHMLDYGRLQQDVNSYRRVETMGNQSLVSDISSYNGLVQKPPILTSGPRYDQITSLKPQFDPKGANIDKYLNLSNVQQRHSTMSMGNQSQSNRSGGEAMLLTTANHSSFFDMSLASRR